MTATATANAVKPPLKRKRDVLSNRTRITPRPREREPRGRHEEAPRRNHPARPQVGRERADEQCIGAHVGAEVEQEQARVLGRARSRHTTTTAMHETIAVITVDASRRATMNTATTNGHTM